MAFTLYKLPVTTGFTYDASGAMKYIRLCTAAGMLPIGCGVGSKYDCDASRVGGVECIPMPASWSCNMESQLHTHTGWNNIGFVLATGGVSRISAN